MEKLLELTEACQVLNMTEDQILYLVRTRGIPHRVEEDGRLTFTKWEITGRIIPSPPAAAMPRQNVDVSKMSKDEIMEVFSAILQQKAAEESKKATSPAPQTVAPHADKTEPEPGDETPAPEEESKEKTESEEPKNETGPEKETEPEKKPVTKPKTKPKTKPATKPTK